MKKQKKVMGSLARPMAITVKGVVFNSKNEVLLIRRSKDDPTNSGKYDLPGGTIEKDETVKETVSREVKEETGIDVEGGRID